jgi:hypothetical protein
MREDWDGLIAWRNKRTALHGMGLGFMHSIALRSGIKIV